MIASNIIMLREEIKKQTFGYIVGALGLVAGLAWNDAVRALIEYFFPLSQNTLLAKFIYAAAVTVIVVIFTRYILGGGTEEDK